MKIDYRKFDESSKKTRERIIEFARVLISIVEMYGSSKIPSTQFENAGFQCEEIAVLIKKINEMLGVDIIATTKGWHFDYPNGQKDSKRMVTEIDLKYKPDTISTLQLLLKRWDIHTLSYHTSSSSTPHQKALDKKIAEARNGFIDDLMDSVLDQKAENFEGRNIPSTRTIEKNGIGFFLIDGREIKIGAVKNVPFKLLETLCPLGTQKSVDMVYKNSTTRPNKEALTNTEKQVRLSRRLKELQEIFNSEKCKSKDRLKIALDNDDATGNVSLKLK